MERTRPLAGLRALVGALQARSRPEIDARVDVPADLALPDAMQTAGYRIAQAALDNALRHSGATRVTVEVIARHGFLIVRIADDGAGFEASNGGDGIAMMERWAREAGGRLDVKSAPSAGTCISARFPLKPARQ